jgi:hypothetical protein
MTKHEIVNFIKQEIAQGKYTTKSLCLACEISREQLAGVVKPHAVAKLATVLRLLNFFGYTLKIELKTDETTEIFNQ